MTYTLIIDLCIRLRHRYALRLGAWCCRHALGRMETAGYASFVDEKRRMPICAPVFEQLLIARL